MATPSVTSDEQRFWPKVLKTETCWIWQRQLNNKGYGCFSIVRPDRTRSTTMYAHRFSWTLAHGPIPKGMNVLHKCDTPACVNPSHLFLGTQLDNVRDCMGKGRFKPYPLNHAKITEAQVRAIRMDPRKHHIIAADYGLKRMAVHMIKRRKTWAWVQ